MNEQQGKRLLERTRIIAIVRGVSEEHILGVAEALLEGGIPVMEVTLNTPGAPAMIGKLRERFGERMYIGAGTVLDKEDARKAVDAGALFLVTPNTDEEVIRYGVERGLPVFPGALTPTEIVRAWKAGAQAVKIFPSSSLGLDYLKELQGPLGHIPMIAVGGINAENARRFLEIGCYALGVGSSLINPREIARGNYGWIAENARSLVQQVRQHQ
jgi:2-dehydro-3-deoxyphosphogluconate aldolase/(4S)-4-hydroxy-2-oxoglutarate aldolase